MTIEALAKKEPETTPASAVVDQKVWPSGGSGQPGGRGSCVQRDRPVVADRGVEERELRSDVSLCRPLHRRDDHDPWNWSGLYYYMGSL